MAAQAGKEKGRRFRPRRMLVLAWQKIPARHPKGPSDWLHAKRLGDSFEQARA